MIYTINRMAAADEKRSSEMYIPRKCSWTHKLLPASEKGAVQINVAALDPKTGVYKHNEFDTFVFASKIRSNAHSDKALAKLAFKKGIIWTRC